jgi:hypothetical protein
MQHKVWLTNFEIETATVHLHNIAFAILLQNEYCVIADAASSLVQRNSGDL